ncbi:MAG: hypothetical protein SGILL_003401 [Bacillariaceae sp.]
MHPLIRKLAKPSKVASTLDWKKCNGSTVLALNFHQNRVGIAVASHPSTQEPCIELDDLKFSKTKEHPHTNVIRIDHDCLERFSDIIDEFKVCGIVVSWPLQHDTGRMGKACGRTIFALEQLWEKGQGGNTGVLARPFCLWDADHIVPKQRNDPAKRVDEFGRCADYGTENRFDYISESDGTAAPTAQQDYFASKERYHEDELTMVVEVWNDFCREHWPELCPTSFSAPDELRHQSWKDDIGHVETAEVEVMDSYGT